MIQDGNVAFKVTWVYGEHGPFTTPCTPNGREHNIAEQKKVWCTQGQCPCFTIYKNGNTETYDVTARGCWPCYDSAIFDTWGFSGGVYHHGPKKNQSISIRHFKKGKLAFFTSRRWDMAEKDRKIIGCFQIARYEKDKDHRFDKKMLFAGDLKLRVRDLEKAPRFWNFHVQTAGPLWGTGLFRYIPDQEARAMLRAVEAVAV